MKLQKKVIFFINNYSLFYYVISYFLECANKDYNELRPFKCLDLTYISVLLEQGFGLPLDTSVSVSCYLLSI